MPLLHISLGCIDGHLVGADILGLFGRLFWVVGWFNRSYVFYYTICRCFTSVWVALTVTWSGQISSGCLVDCFGSLAGSIGLMCSIIPYAVLHFSLGCSDG